MSIRFEDKVAIVTGAGNGLGRSHAIALAKRGAKVVVNDLGGSVDGGGSSQSAAQSVVDEIISGGGQAIPHGASVANVDDVNDMVDQVMRLWGRVDILINNAGILRDKSFHKMDLEDFKTVIDVHLMGSVYCTKAVWNIMREQNYGRVVMTTSSSGLYGNFGQTNYAAAKAGVVGFMNALEHEGAKYNIRVNALSPTAATRMTEGLADEDALKLLKPESVTPGVLFLASEEAPSGAILCAGAGTFARSRILETRGVLFTGDDQSPESIATHWNEISDEKGQAEIDSAWAQTKKYLDAFQEQVNEQ